MKRVIPAVCCLAAALLLSVGAYIYIRGNTQRFCSGLQDVLLSAEDEEAFRTAEKLCAEWGEKSSSFGALLKHSDADELEKCFFAIKDCCQADDREQLNKSVKDCLIALKVVLKGEKPNKANIF